MLWIRFFVSVVLVFVMCAPGYAQEDSPPNTDIPVELNLNNTLLASLSTGDTNFSIGARGSDRYTKPEVERQDAESEPTPPLDFDFDLDFRIPTPPLPDYWNTYANQPRTTIVTEYEGFHGVIHKQVSRLARRYFRRMLRDYWEQSHLHPMDLDRAMNQYALNASDWGNRWWEQRQDFWDYYSVENGGARVEVHTVGRRNELFALGPFHVHNTGKVGWSGWRFSVSAENDRPIDVRPFDQRIPADPLLHDDRERQLALGIRPPRGNLYSGDHWVVSGSVKFNVRVNDLSMNNGSRIRGSLEIIGLQGFRRIPWIGITLRGTARPFRNEYGATIQISLLRW